MSASTHNVTSAAVGAVVAITVYVSDGGPSAPHGVQVRCWGDSNTAGDFTDMKVGFVRIQAIPVSNATLFH